MMKTSVLSALTLSLIVVVHGSMMEWDQANATTKPELILEARRLDGEFEGSATTEVAFMNDITKNDDWPEEAPTRDEYLRLYDKRIGRVIKQARKEGDTSIQRVSEDEINPKFETCSLKEYYQLFKLKCCPRHWNYACRSVTQQLNCAYHSYGGRLEWCCVLWPSIYYQRCICDNCAVLDDYCVHKGRCQNRFVLRGFVAVCHRKNSWDVLRYIRRWMPSTCYCRLDN